MAEPKPQGSTASLKRRQLSDALRSLRDDADLTQEQAALAVEWSTSKIIRIEAGAVGVTVSDLRSLLRIYHVDDEAQIQALLKLARSTRARSWLSPYKDQLPKSFADYVELEANATKLRQFQTTLIPGLLQTREYVEWSIVNGLRATSRPEHSVQMLVSVRMRRQSEMFDRADRPEMYFVLDESVLRRTPGDSSILRNQLAYLLRCGSEPSVHIHIHPFSHSMTGGEMFGSFTILEFEDSARPLLYQEGAFNDQVVRDKSDLIAMYRKAFDTLLDAALDEDESLAFIKRVADEMS